MQRQKLLFPMVLLGVCLLLVALGGLVGYRLGSQPGPEGRAWLTPAELEQNVRMMRDIETLEGAFAVDGTSLAGVEKCYYDAVDFTQITWTGRDMPTPFLGFAPQPGPIPSGHINGQQFRYRQDVDRSKPAGTCRIFLIGGSTAFGSGASTNETTVAGYLERCLNEREKQYGRRFEVITAAATAWASAHERILVENYLIEFEPDVVVALSGHNDVFWSLLNYNVNCYRGPQDAYYLQMINSLLKSNFNDGFPDDLPNGKVPISPALTAARLRRNVGLAHAALQTVGADYCFALQPVLSCSRKVRTPREEHMASRHHPLGVIAHRSEFEVGYGECRTALSGLKLPRYHFWDLTPMFDGVSGQDIFIDRCHFGDRGHDLIAQRLHELLGPVLQARFKSVGP